MVRDVLETELLVEIVVPHVPVVDRFQTVKVLRVLTSQELFSPLGIRGQIETLRGHIEATLQELLYSFSDSIELELIGFYLNTFWYMRSISLINEGDNLNFLQFKNAGRSVWHGVVSVRNCYHL
jgi:hypothetical protein